MKGQKRMFRSRQDKIIAGVCGGIAEFYDADPVWIRLATVLLTLAWGTGLIIYIVLWIVMPLNPDQKPSVDTMAERTAKKLAKKAQSVHDKKESHTGHFVIGFVIILIGALFLLKNMFHWFSFNFIWPALLILLGIYLIGRRKK
ncbi:MAG: PspC domain-containing protein [Candidatus Woesearchaeota archaeon]